MALQDRTFANLTNSWEASERHTAAANEDAILSNTSAYVMFMVLTADDTEPSGKPREGHPVAPMSSATFQLKAGERLWVAGADARGRLTVD